MSLLHGGVAPRLLALAAMMLLISCVRNEPMVTGASNGQPVVSGEEESTGPTPATEERGSALADEPGSQPATDAGGLNFEMRIIGEDNYAVVYRVKSSGVFEFSGGRDVLSDRVTWTTTLTQAEVEALHRVIEANRWYTHQPAGGETQQGEPVRTISVSGRGPGGGLHLVVRGRHARVEPVREFLESMSNRRLEGELRSLPRAGERLPG